MGWKAHLSPVGRFGHLVLILTLLQLSIWFCSCSKPRALHVIAIADVGEEGMAANKILYHNEQVSALISRDKMQLSSNYAPTTKMETI